MSKRALTWEKVSAWPWLTIGKIVGVIVAVVIVVLIYRQIFVVPGELRREGAQAKLDTKAATAEVKMTREAMDQMQERSEVAEQTRVIVRESTREIRTAPGASNQIPPAVHDAGIAAIRELRKHHADQRPAD